MSPLFAPQGYCPARSSRGELRTIKRLAYAAGGQVPGARVEGRATAWSPRKPGRMWRQNRSMLVACLRLRDDENALHPGGTMNNFFGDERTQELLTRGFSRRSFGRIAALMTAGAALPFYIEAAQARDRDAIPSDAVRIDYNENPMGPCPEAVEA